MSRNATFISGVSRGSAIPTTAGDLDHLTMGCKTALRSKRAQLRIDLRRGDFAHLAAGLANEESHTRRAIMAMTAGEIGIAGRQPVDEPVLLQEVERPINGHRGRPLAGGFRHQIDHLIGPHGTAGGAELVQHQLAGRSEAQTRWRMGTMAMIMMVVHGANIGFSNGSDQVPRGWTHRPLAKIAAAH
ncbi:MAG: hypothetical protein RIQ68_2257 [Pseudomonadota bacterium]